MIEDAGAYDHAHDTPENPASSQPELLFDLGERLLERHGQACAHRFAFMHVVGMSFQVEIMRRVIPTPDHRAVGRLPMERVVAFVRVEKFPCMQRRAIGQGDYDPVVVTAVLLAILDDIEPANRRTRLKRRKNPHRGSRRFRFPPLAEMHSAPDVRATHHKGPDPRCRGRPTSPMPSAKRRHADDPKLPTPRANDDAQPAVQEEPPPPPVFCPT